MTDKIAIQIVQSEGSDGKYAKLKIEDLDGMKIIDLKLEQLGELIAGVRIEAAFQKFVKRRVR